MLRVVMTPSKSYSSLHLIHSTKENHKASNSIEKSSNPFVTIEQDGLGNSVVSNYSLSISQFCSGCIRKYLITQKIY